MVGSFGSPLLVFAASHDVHSRIIVDYVCLAEDEIGQFQVLLQLEEPVDLRLNSKMTGIRPKELLVPLARCIRCGLVVVCRAAQWSLI